MGIVYALTNEYMPGLIKIGMTGKDDVRHRMNEINRATGVPVPFECLKAVEVDDHKYTEREVHKVFASRRTNPMREFFGVNEDEVLALLNLIGTRDVTPDVENDLESGLNQSELGSKRKPNTRFISMLGLNIGDTLVFTKDSTITCTIHSENEVMYNYEIFKLSPLTKHVWPDDIEHDLDGVRYWSFNGVKLKDLREQWFSRQTGTP